MQLALPSPMPDASPAVFAVNAEKPHQGVAGKNPGLHRGFFAVNSTTALGVSWGQWSGTVPGARVRYEYDAYGNEFTVSGSTPNEMMYRGEQYDPDLGLYYLRARYYNPLTGRFMSRDPLDPQPLNPGRIPVDLNDLHKYLYAAGDPVNLLDPTGMATAYNPAYQKSTLGNAIGEYLGLVNGIALRAFVITQVVIPAYLQSDQGRKAIYVLVAGSTLAIGIVCEALDVVDVFADVHDAVHRKGAEATSPGVSCPDGVDSGAGDTGDQ
jgi:RHS repeat-associated protein